MIMADRWNLMRRCNHQKGSNLSDCGVSCFDQKSHAHASYGYPGSSKSRIGLTAEVGCTHVTLKTPGANCFDTAMCSIKERNM
jgi:hypothetical protein